MSTTPFSAEHPWVLVEGRSDEALDTAVQLRRVGYEVATCEGPSDERPCPLVERDSCPMVECAPLVVNALGPLDADGAIEHAASRRTAVVRMGDPTTDPDCLTAPVTTEKLMRSIRSAYRRHAEY